MVQISNKSIKEKLIKEMRERALKMDKKNKKKPKEKKEKVEEASEEKKSKKKEEPKEESEEQKKEKERKKKEEELKEKYGVMKEIPKQKIKDGKKTEEVKSKESKDEIASLTDLVLKTEKLDGKLDVVSGYKDDLNDRIAQISEEIGELRSMIMDTDRSFGKIEKSFEEIKEVVGDVEPLRVKKGFEKKEQEIMENRVKIEKIENLVKALEKESKNYRKIMEKIKSFENLVEISEKIDKKIRSIEETKKYSDRTAAKVESIFSEVTDKVNELQKQKEKILRVDELTTEITQMLDEISIKMKDFAKTKEVKDFKEEMKKEIESISESRNRIEEVGKLLKETQLDEKLLEVGEVKSKINNFEKRIENINKKLTDLVDYKTLKKVVKTLEEDYQKIKENRQKIVQLNGSLSSTKEDIKELRKIERRLKNFKNLDQVTSNLEEGLSRINEFKEIPANMTRIKKIVEKQNNVISDIIGNMERVKSIPDINIEELNNIDLSLRFYQLLNILPFLDDKVKLKEYSEEMKSIIKKMKELGSWNPKKEKFMNDLLKISKKISRPADQNELLEKVGKLATWTSRITDKVKERELFERELQQDLENLKESLKNKVDSRDVEDIYILERDLMELTGKFNKLKSVIERQNILVDDVLEKVRRVESEKMVGLKERVDKLNSVVQGQNFVINKLITKVKEKEVKVDKKTIDDLQTTVRFYQLLNMLPYVIEPSRIKAYLVELKDIIEILKSNEKWDSEKERFMKNFLSSLSDNYESRGYEEIGSAYAEIV